jgi:predicted Zn-dependent protease
MTTGGTIPPDSLIREFLKTHPDNRTAMVYLYHWLAHIGKIDECGPLVERLVSLYPTDFSVNLLAAIYYRTISGLSGDQSLLSKAAEYLDRAVRYNPVNEEVLRQMYLKSTPDMMTI